MRVRALVDVYIGGGYRAAGTEFSYDGEPDPNLAIVPEQVQEQLQPMIRVGDTVTPELLARLQIAAQAGVHQQRPTVALPTLPAQSPVADAGFVPGQLAAVQAAAAAAQPPVLPGPPPASPDAVLPSAVHPLAVRTIMDAPPASMPQPASMSLPASMQPASVVDDGRDLLS